MRVILYTDGGARGNPGPAASAAVLFDKNGKLLDSVSLYLGKTTNNQAEYQAVIIGLKKAKEIGARVVDVRMDSELVVKQMKGEYRVKDEGLARRHVEARNECRGFDNVTFTHVRREQNKDADALVNKVLDEQYL